MNQKLKSYTAQTYIAYALIAPAALYIILIVAWPLLETIRLSFTNSSLAGEDYVGLENYQKMFSSKKFNGIVTRTFVWMFFSVSLKLIIGLIGAVLLNANLKGRSIFRVLVMPPWVVPIAIGMLGWLWLYNGYFGRSFWISCLQTKCLYFYNHCRCLGWNTNGNRFLSSCNAGCAKRFI